MGSSGELVEPQREALGGAPVVDEDDRRAVRADLLEQLGVDRGPDRLAGRLAAGERVELDVATARARPCDSTGTWIFRSSGLRVPVSTIVHVRLGPTRKRPTSSSGFCVARQPDPLERRRSACSASRSSVSARCAPRLVCATAWISSTITCSAPVEDLARLAREHQVERLGRRDQDVRRVADHVAPVLLRRVAGADADPDVGADPAQRRAQVLLHVVGERLERRDVDEPACDRCSARRRAGRAPRGTRRASCPSRSGPRSGCGRPWRSPARPGTGRPSAPRTPARTSRAPAG